jgi:NtrC-family two-component system response regulator AlgB
MCLEAEGHQPVACGTIEEALDAVAREAFDLIFLDLRLGMHNGLDYIPQLLHENPWTRIIVITAYASVDTAVEAMKRGASHYQPKPFEAAQVRLVTRSVAERRQLERRVEALQSAIGEHDPEADLPTADPTMRAAIELAQQVAPSRANLVIRGEIGTGKGRLARAIHLWSKRSAEPFVVVSCRSDAEEALEAELFGPGNGKVEFCGGGTLVLDEVGQLPLRLQPLVLRLLKEQEYERPEETTRRRTDVRVIATASQDLERSIEAGNFRADLLLALNVVQIDVPPLRQRPADIPMLAERYLARFNRENHAAVTRFTPSAMDVLTRHRWPGNVRELRNVVERAVLLCRCGEISVEHLPNNLLNSPANISLGDLVPLSAVEEYHIRKVVASTRSLRQAAIILQIDSGTLVRRMKRYDAPPPAAPHASEHAPALLTSHDQPAS